MLNLALISFLNTSINIRVLSSYLKKYGYNVTCLFCSIDFNQRNLYELLMLLKEKDITFVGISLGTDNYRSAVIATKEIKSKLGLPVIWGGAHVNVKPEESLRHADMICMGEGEDALLELVENMSNGNESNTSIKNIWFKTKNSIIRNELRNLEEDLDKYPFADLDLSTQFVMNETGFEKLNDIHFKGEYSTMTSRGCPYKCKYCYNNYRWDQYSGKGRYLRMRSIKKVIDELSHIKTIFKNLKVINFWDDSFLARKTEDFIEFKELYTKEIGLPFFCLVEPMAFKNEKVKILRESGLIGLQVGIQTGSERINKEIYKRPVTNKKVLDVAHYINQLGIKATYDVIFNNPYENHDDIRETINLFLNFPRPVSLQGYNLIFYPGTDITDNALKDGYISIKEDFDDFSTIESKKDSPLATYGEAQVSSRFYRINYDSSDKIFLNTVISLFNMKIIPNWFIKYIAQSENIFNRIILRMICYSFQTALKMKHLSWR